MVFVIELVEDSDETDLDEETMVKSPLIDLKGMLIIECTTV